MSEVAERTDVRTIAPPAPDAVTVTDKTVNFRQVLGENYDNPHDSLSDMATLVIGIDRGVTTPEASTEEAVANWEGMQQIGDYTLIDKIGQGGDGVVYEAVGTDGKHNEHIALKLPHTTDNKEGYDSNADSIRDEIALLKKFGKFASPFLQGYIDDGTIENPAYPGELTPYIIMELSKTGDLADLRNAGHSYSYAEAGIIIAQVADALTAMNDEGFGHRDVKTKNILVTKAPTKEEDIEVQLTDFGASAEFTNTFEDKPFRASLAYTAPEEFQGIRSAKSDAYELGALYYSLITKDALFTTTQQTLLEDVRIIGNQEAYDAHIDDKLANLPKALQEPLRQVFERDPEKRPDAWFFAGEINTAIFEMQKDPHAYPKHLEAPQTDSDNDEQETIPLGQARESWVSGYEDGNRLTPQAAQVGLPLMTLSAVLKDRPDNWEEFFNSRFTPKQMDRIGRNMSRMHHKAGVDKAVEAHMRPGDTRVFEDKIQNIWFAEKYAITGTTVLYINTVREAHNLPKITVGKNENGTYNFEPALPEINAFFADPANADAVDRLNNMVQVAQDCLTDKDKLPLLALHREAILKDHKKREKGKNHFSRMILNDYRPPKEIGVNILSSIIADRVQEEYPEEDLKWLHWRITRQEASS